MMMVRGVAPLPESLRCCWPLQGEAILGVHTQAEWEAGQSLGSVLPQCLTHATECEVPVFMLDEACWMFNHELYSSTYPS
jgi:hypothetical protein